MLKAQNNVSSNMCRRGLPYTTLMQTCEGVLAISRHPGLELGTLLSNQPVRVIVVRQDEQQPSMATALLITAPLK